MNLAELFRHPGDIEDLLAAYGEPVPRDPKVARSRALEILEVLDPAAAVQVLFTFAKAVGRMAGKVTAFCSERGTAFLAEIQFARHIGSQHEKAEGRAGLAENRSP